MTTAFTLNKPAIQTAGQIFNQQCHAAAVVVRDSGQHAAVPTPPPAELIMDAITQLTLAAQGHKAGQREATAQGLRSVLETRLARAAVHIFDLAASQGIDLGTAVAEHLEDETTRF